MVKKYISRVVWLILVILLASAKSTYGLHQTGDDVSSIILYQQNYQYINEWGEIAEEEILKTLKDDYGYEGGMVTPLRINTTVTITDSSKFSRKYKVKLGNKELDTKYTKKELISTFGYEGPEDGDIEVGTSWSIIIGAEVKEPDPETDPSYTSSTGMIPITFYEYTIRASEIWTGNDKPRNTQQEDVDPETESIGGSITDVTDTIAEFLKDPIGNICKFFLDLLLKLFDAIQMLINIIQTSTLHTVSDWKITYGYEALLLDQEQGKEMEDVDPESEEYDNSAGHRDMYTKVGEYKKRNTKSYRGQKYVYIDGGEKGFDELTEIPVIPIDIYNLAVGDVGFVDINFFTSENHEDNSPWTILRNIAVAIMRITIYLGAAILLTMLIWHGVNIVKTSLDNPEAKVAHREGLKKFFISLLMLVGSIFIMTLCIFASELFLGELQSKEKDHEQELPIRMNVEFSDEENAEDEDSDGNDSHIKGYSFSTNITGYIRYMAQTDSTLEKAIYTVSYMVMVIINVIAGLGMLMRMFIMLFLSILGPIIAVLHGIGIENNKILNYKTWVELYISLAAIQIFLIITTRIVLECSIFN